VAPIDSTPESPLAVGKVAPRASKERQAVFEARQDLVRCEHVDARRGEFDRKRQSIKAPADGGDG